MKPLSEKTYVEQALTNQKGITWLDDCRIPYDGDEGDNQGRFPANLLVSDDVLNGEQEYSRYFDLDKWAQKTLPFLIVPKASKSEKDKGLEDMPKKQIKGGGGTHNEEAGAKFGSIKAVKHNSHPTVKPIKLMSYLITMGSRQGDLILDPFSGSGTTCVAAKTLGRNYIGIELSEEYANIARKRLEAVTQTTL